MAEREFVIILSDIHIGIPSSDEKYFLRVLDDIIACKNDIKEVILLGDIFELWAYPPDELPPTLEDIITFYPNILGIHGKLNEALTALEGRVVFIPGDHDMMVSEADLKKLRNQEGYTIKYKSDAYIPDYDKHTLFTHGNAFTLLNAPFYRSRLAPLPLGYFLSRVISCNKGNKDYMFSITNFLLKNQALFKCSFNGFDFMSEFVNTIAYIAGMPRNFDITIDKNTKVSLNDIKWIYKEVFDEDNLERLILSLIGELNGMYFPFYAKEYAKKKGADFVIAGHTHTALFPINDGSCQYANTGTMCASDSLMSMKPITCGIFNCFNRKFELIKMGDGMTNSIQSYLEERDSRKTVINTKENIPNLESSEKQLTFGWSVYNQEWEYYKIMQEGVLSKAKELGIDVITKDQKNNSVEMVTGSIELIKKDRVNALLISPYDPQEIPYIVKNADQNGIPVVVIDGGTAGADVLAFIVSDSFGGGILAGEYALTLIQKYSIASKNTAIIKAEKTATYALRRGEGFQRVMIENGYQVVYEASANGRKELAYEEMKKILAIYKKDLAVVFCENGNMTLGAAQAIEEAGEKGKIMLIGFDADPSVIEAIKMGMVQGTIAQQPFKMGEIGVEIAYMGVLKKSIQYDDWTTKEILMEVYLIDESGKPSINLR
ncbi:MAG: substrate-binding domain-containing protein [Velocimicrobium sp.]